MHQPVSEHSRPSSFTVLLQDAKTEKFALGGLVILIAYAVLRNLVGAATRPFWYDEVCTWIVVRQPSLSGIWDALKNAADSQPPAFYFVERLSSILIRNEDLALRLPSILAFCCITICVFVFARRRANGAYALVCSAIPLATILFNWYAVEARPYSLVVACIAFALVAYQRAPSPAWMFAMGLALAASASFSYYAVLSLAPFGLAELQFLIVRRQIRWGVWMALVCGVIPLALFWPLLAYFRHYYGGHYWAQASLSGFIHIYGSFFMSTPPLGVAIAAAALLGMAALIVVRAAEPVGTAEETSKPAHEYVLVLALVGLPAIGFLAAKLTHTGMMDRYVLSSVLGISLAAAYLLPILDRRSVALAIGALIAMLSVQEASFWVAHKSHLTRFESPDDSLESLIVSAGYPDLPVVVSDGLEYLPIARYAAPPWSERFVTLVDLSEAVAFAGADTLEKELIVFRSIAPVNVYDFSSFVELHSSFLLYSSSGSRGDPHDWWATRLLRDGYALKALAVDHDRVIYLVTRTSETH